MNEITLAAQVRTVIGWLLLTGLGIWVVNANRSLIFLLVLSWLVAIAMEPAIGYFGRHGLGRSSAAALTLLLLAALLAAFGALFGSLLISQAAALITSLPNAVTGTVDWLNTHLDLKLNPAQIQQALAISPSSLAGFAGNLAGGVLGILSSLLGGIFQLLTLLLFAFYIAADGPRLQKLIGSWLRPSRQQIFVTTWDITVAKTGGFVTSKLVLASICAVAHGIFFALIGVQYWLPLAILTGVISQFIPTIGTYLGILLPIAFSLFQNPIDALWIAIFAGIYQQLENYLISPRISRMTMNIHPAVAFGSVLVFANLFGALGAIVSVPIAAAIIAVLDTYGRRYELIPELADIPQSD